MAFMLTCTIDMYVTSCLLFCLFLSNKLTFVRLLSVNMHCLVFSVFDSGVWTPHRALSYSDVRRELLNVFNLLMGTLNP